MKTYDDVKVVETVTVTNVKTGEPYTYTSEHISLSKLFDRKVVDLYVSISREFDGSVLSVHQVVFDDGTSLIVDGEHDIAYLTVPYRQEGNFPQYTARVLGPIYNTQNCPEGKYDEDGEENEDYWDWEEDE